MKKNYKDYKLVWKTLPNGKTKQVAEYIGQYYVCQLTTKEFRRYKFYYLALVLCSGTIAIGAGLINNPGSKVAYVALPYVSLLIPITISFIGTIDFISSGIKIKQIEYVKTKLRIKRSTICQMVLSSLAGIGNIMLTISDNNEAGSWINGVFTGSMLLILIISIAFFSLQMKVNYRVEDTNYSE
ncbi:MAG: hypothetical protein GX319_01010 [Clostridiales bacterium]|jgi:ABC-type Fe3+-siderophore transport system permease subunit|nr:hypothetical protein [Bacillota bacterium]NLK02968.1 hypothetical protein [Clostridiales bacterium]